MISAKFQPAIYLNLLKYFNAQSPSWLLCVLGVKYLVFKRCEYTPITLQKLTQENNPVEIAVQQQIFAFNMTWLKYARCY